jgi:cytochrome c-type biogenesis protein CcmH
VLSITTNNMTLEGRPMELVERALAIDPRHQKALWLAGTAKYERQEFEQAREYWQRLLVLVPPGSDVARAMGNNIAEVESLIAQRDGQEAQPPATIAEAAPVSGTIKGTVGIDDALRDRVSPSDTVFIFARAAEGPRMPLAVLRVRVDELPMDYVLDDSMAMDPSQSLSQFPEVVVVARVSLSGSAMAESGDLQGVSTVISPGSDESALVTIDEILP